MGMIYLRDGSGKTYAMPNHIIEDFEVSNVRVEDASERVPATQSKLDRLWATLELDITVAELASILGLDAANIRSMPSSLCAGLPPEHGGEDLSLRGLCGGLAARHEGIGLCGGLTKSEWSATAIGGQQSLLRFFSDPRLQNTKLRLKAEQLNDYLYRE
jgi:hypothetical protein